MGPGKNRSAQQFLIDRYQLGIRAWPLFGMDRLVTLPHRNRPGVLHCDNVLRLSVAISFSDSNRRNSLYKIPGSTKFPGFLSSPRVNVRNEAADENTPELSDDGTELMFGFTPIGGQTYSLEYDTYRPFNLGHRLVRCELRGNARIATMEMSLDLSGYQGSGVAVETPRCEFEPIDPKRGRRAGAPASYLIAAKKQPGPWVWKTDNISGGAIRIWWDEEIRDPQPPREFDAAIIEKLTTELRVNPRLAKDLHNFVGICHYYAAGFRSLNAIGPEMIAGKMALIRSVEAVEAAIGTDVFQRTRGKGLIRITPAGEVALDWWSQFYMRWTPMSSSAAGPQ